MRAFNVQAMRRKDGKRWRRTEAWSSTYEGLRSFIQTANILDPHPAPINHPNVTSTFISATSVPSPTRLQPIDKRQKVLIGSFHAIAGDSQFCWVLTWRGFPEPSTSRSNLCLPIAPSPKSETRRTTTRLSYLTASQGPLHSSPPYSREDWVNQEIQLTRKFLK